MAWTERLASGRWRGGYRDSAGRKRYTGPYTRKTDAREAAQEAEVRGRREAAIAAGTLSAKITWGTWWDMNVPERPDSETDLTDQDLVRRYIRPQWGDTPLVKIQRKQVQKWVDGLVRGRSARYVRRIYATFATSIARAVEEEVLTTSPCVKIKLPIVPRRVKSYADEKHLEILRRSGQKDRPHLRDSGHRDLTEVGLQTGLRPGELCGLHADQVDLDGGWLTVSNTMLGRKLLIRPWPKDKDTRPVPLTEKAVEILRRRLDGRDLSTGCGIPHTDEKVCHGELVFRNDRGGHITPRAVYQAMRDAAVRAGVANRSPYALRRGFATRAAEGGMDAFGLKSIMGHASLDQTDEYVQQTSAVRDRLRVALGESTGLTVIRGADPGRGAESGAESHRQAPDDAGTRSADQDG